MGVWLAVLIGPVTMCWQKREAMVTRRTGDMTEMDIGETGGRMWTGDMIRTGATDEIRTVGMIRTEDIGEIRMADTIRTEAAGEIRTADMWTRDIGEIRTDGMRIGLSRTRSMVTAGVVMTEKGLMAAGELCTREKGRTRSEEEVETEGGMVTIERGGVGMMMTDPGAGGNLRTTGGVRTGSSRRKRGDRKASRKTR